MQRIATNLKNLDLSDNLQKMVESYTVIGQNLLFNNPSASKNLIFHFFCIKYTFFIPQ